MGKLFDGVTVPFVLFMVVGSLYRETTDNMTSQSLHLGSV
jgi:hypothetical protein